MFRRIDIVTIDPGNIDHDTQIAQGRRRGRLPHPLLDRVAPCLRRGIVIDVKGEDRLGCPLMFQRQACEGALDAVGRVQQGQPGSPDHREILRVVNRVGKVHAFQAQDIAGHQALNLIREECGLSYSRKTRYRSPTHGTSAYHAGIFSTRYATPSQDEIRMTAHEILTELNLPIYRTLGRGKRMVHVVEGPPTRRDDVMAKLPELPADTELVCVWTENAADTSKRVRFDAWHPAQMLDVADAFMNKHRGRGLKLSLDAAGKRVHLGASRADHGDGGITDLASRWLAAILGELRPLLAWESRFVQVFAAEPTSSREAPALPLCGGLPHGFTTLRDIDAPDRAHSTDHLDSPYLLPHLRKIFAKAPGDAEEVTKMSAHHGLWSYGWTPPAGSLFTIEKLDKATGTATPVMTVPLARLLVHVGFGGITLLEWAVRADCVPETEQSLLKICLLDRADDASVVTLSDLLQINTVLRRAYSTFNEPEMNVRVTLTLGPNRTASIETHNGPVPDPDAIDKPIGWLALLAERAKLLLGRDIGRLVLDDRARVQTSAILAGERSDLEPAIEREDQLLARLADVEDAGAGWPYSAAFARDELEHRRYGRFTDSGTHFTIADHAFALMAYGKFGFENVIRHMRGPYNRLWLIAQFYEAFLQVTAGRFAACDMTKRDALNAVRESFLHFAARLHAEKVSSQLQACDLFNRMRAALTLDQRRIELAEDLNRAVSIAEIADSRRATERREEFALVVTAAAVTLAGYDLLDKLCLDDASGWAKMAGLVVSLLFGALIGTWATGVLRHESLCGMVCRGGVRGIVRRLLRPSEGRRP
ncbi:MULTISPECIES: hypothetical protein [Tistrella]